MSHHRPWETKKLEGAEAERVIQQIVRAMPFYKWGCRLTRVFNVVFFIWFIAGLFWNGLFIKITRENVMVFSFIGLILYYILLAGLRVTRYKISIVNIEEFISKIYFRIFVECALFCSIYTCFFVVANLLPLWSH
ncbi:MAG: hypothetical protein LBG78_02790 [Azoarcus sp.]|jgi:hypothetical protein|nr:hypothetical protein [Azoarcus sp.]